MFSASLVASGLIYWLLICRALYKCGAKFPTGWLPWRVFRELHIYREIQNIQARSLAPYYAMYILIWFNLILLITVLVLALWEATQTVV